MHNIYNLTKKNLILECISGIISDILVIAMLICAYCFGFYTRAPQVTGSADSVISNTGQFTVVSPLIRRENMNIDLRGIHIQNDGTVLNNVAFTTGDSRSFVVPYTNTSVQYGNITYTTVPIVSNNTQSTQIYSRYTSPSAYYPGNTPWNQSNIIADAIQYANYFFRDNLFNGYSIPRTNRFAGNFTDDYAHYIGTAAYLRTNYAQQNVQNDNSLKTRFHLFVKYDDFAFPTIFGDWSVLTNQPLFRWSFMDVPNNAELIPNYSVVREVWAQCVSVSDALSQSFNVYQEFKEDLDYAPYQATYRPFTDLYVALRSQEIENNHEDNLKALYLVKDFTYSVTIKFETTTDVRYLFSDFDYLAETNVSFSSNVADYITANFSTENTVTPPIVENPGNITGWLGTLLSGLFDTEIFPGITLGGMFLTIIAIPTVLWLLKLFAGG